MSRIFLICFVLSSFISLNIFAETTNRDGFWFGTFSNKEFLPKVSWHLEGQFRYSLDTGGVSQFLYRTGPLYKLNKKHRLGFLFAYVSSDNAKEHRFTVQHEQTYFQKKSFKFAARSRVEARFFEDIDDEIFRARYLLRADIKRFVVWNEAFINLDDSVLSGERVFERNRLFLGMKFKVSDSRLEVGYLNQYVPRGVNKTMEHLLVAYLFL